MRLCCSYVKEVMEEIGRRIYGVFVCTRFLLGCNYFKARCGFRVAAFCLVIRFCLYGAYWSGAVGRVECKDVLAFLFAGSLVSRGSGLVRGFFTERLFFVRTGSLISFSGTRG